jgi:hypothetical protein
MPESRVLYLQIEGASALPSRVLLNGNPAGECSLEGDSLIIALPRILADEGCTVEVLL